MDYVYVGSGGISVGGPQHYSLDVDYEAVSGGLVFGGSADAAVPIRYNYEMSGGIVLGGVAADDSYVKTMGFGYTGAGGVVVGGAAAVQGVTYSYVMSGGIHVSGPDNNVRDYDACMDQAQPIIIGGSAIVKAVTAFNYTMSGGIHMGGGIAGTSSTYVYTGSGGIVIGGQAPSPGGEIIIDLAIGWQTLADVVIDIPIGWNTGKVALFFFRIEGECLPYACPPIYDGSESEKNCNFSFITNIVSDSICDVCAQLSRKRFLRTIKSIKRFSRPARTADIEAFEESGVPQDCNTLEEIEFCQCFECAQYCQVVEDVNETNQNDGETSDYVYVGNGRIFIRGHSPAQDKPNVIEGLTASTANILTNCGCSVPSEIYFTHDFAKANRLKDFLNRNGLEIQRVVPLQYTKSDQLWYGNLSYRGKGIDGSTDERWTLVFNLQCTNIVDGNVDYWNPYYWKFGVNVRQQNLSDNSFKDTRLQLTFSEEGPCLKGEMNVRAFLNTRTLTVQPIQPPNISLGASMEDKIGLFKSDYWAKHPRFLIDLDVHNRDVPERRIQFGPLYPQVEVSRLN